MAKLKKTNTKVVICPTCKGNGFVKVASFDSDDMIHQCWDCHSKGEFDVHESEISQHDVVDNNNRTTDKFLH